MTIQLDIEKSLYIIMLGIVLWSLLKSYFSCRRTETIHPYKAYLFLNFYYLPYLLFPWLILIFYQWYHNEINHLQAISMLVINVLLIYARFIEPNHVVVRERHFTIDENLPMKKTLKIALIADLHIGLFSGKERQLQKIVRLINEQVEKNQIDCVVVAGDWTYEPENRLAEELYMLKEIQVPIYSVNGNHDEQYPGPPIQALLADALEKNNVINIENKIIEFDECCMLGTGDLWAGKTQLDVMKEFPQDKPYIIVAHNPDSVDLVPKLATRPLMLSGHTHGGQIELPFITSYAMRKISILGHKRGYYMHENASVFVTTGTGMIGAPFRFRVPPVIDVLYLN